MHYLLLTALLWLALLMQPAAAEFPTVYNSEPDADVPQLSPAAAARRIDLPAGFRAHVVAAEPDVQNPIAMTWDARGRIWIAENYTYAERDKRFDLTLHDRVLVLEDTDGDGAADQRAVFTDDVQMLTGIEVGRGGVWLICPPNLLFLPDADRDDVADGPAEIVLDGFTVARGNYHNFANGLRWGPDGWLYGRCGGSCPGRIGVPGTPDERRLALEGGIWRYHPQRRDVEVLATGTTNPWGHDWDEFYEGFFVNTVNGHLWHLIPGSHLVRPFTLDPNPYVYELIDLHADHWHFDTGKSWTDSRDGAANDYGGGHAHVGTMIYLGGLWPDTFHNRLLTFNMHGRRANRERLERHGSGYLARHEPDVIFSRDPWFRGMELSYGPDGNVVIIDWSDIGECHEHNGVHRTSGRVYKITYQDARHATLERLIEQSDAAQFDLHHETDLTLARLHESTNEWFVRQARIELTTRSETGGLAQDAVQTLSRLCHDHQNPVVRLRAMLTLYGANLASHEDLLRRLQDDNEHLRAWAIRLLTDRWPLDDAACRADKRPRPAISPSRLGLLEHLATKDPSSLVRLALCSTIQRLPIERRAALAAAVSTSADEADDHNLPLLLWYGLIPVAEANPDALVPVWQACTWSKSRQLIARRLAEMLETHPAAIEGLIEMTLASQDDARVRDLLHGMAQGLRGIRQVTAPTNWPQFVRRVEESRDGDLTESVRNLNVRFGDGVAMAELHQVALNEDVDPAARLNALNTLIEARADGLRDTCRQLLGDGRLNVTAAKGLALEDDPEIGALIAASYKRFRHPTRPQIIALLVSRESFAESLLNAIEEDVIPADHLSAFDVRQLNSLGNSLLTQRVSQIWGNVRESSAEKRTLIDRYKQLLQTDQLATADKSQGRLLFQQKCATCHRLYGAGEHIGPDLTGANRNNLDYLLENIVDPSAVVGKDFRMTILELTDGRVLNGLVVTQNRRTLTLQTQTDRVVIPQDEIFQATLTSLSPMPDGLLDNLTPAQVADLIAYLQHPAQIDLHEEHLHEEHRR